MFGHTPLYVSSESVTGRAPDRSRAEEKIIFPSAIDADTIHRRSAGSSAVLPAIWQPPPFAAPFAASYYDLLNCGCAPASSLAAPSSGGFLCRFPYRNRTRMVGSPCV